MKEPRWVLAPTVLALHEQLIAQFGGSSGLRSRDLFESALARPRQQFTYGAPNLFELAAAYAFGLAKNHAFLDGNKRIAFAVAALLLKLNRFELRAREADATIQVLALAAGGATEAQMAAWLEEHSIRLSAGRR